MNTQDQQLTSSELQKQLQVVTEENVSKICSPKIKPNNVSSRISSPQLQLRDKNERLFIKVGYLESRLGHLASSNTDLSCRLVQSEEERLKVENIRTIHTSPVCISPRTCFPCVTFQISKEFVEEKIETNKMRERLEEETFELKNKVRITWIQLNFSFKVIL